MKHPLFFKLSAIAILMLLLMIPINMISGIINDRKQLHEHVIEEIAKSSSYSQKLVGPVLVVPYVKRIKEWKLDAQTKARYQEEIRLSSQLYFLPEAFVVDGNLRSEKRSRGIYEARLYHADNNISGHFDVPVNYGVTDNVEDYEFATPYVAMGIKDIRGIENALKIRINDELIEMAPSSRLKMLGDGVHATVKIFDIQQKNRLNFSLNLLLQGTESLSVVPIGRDSKVTINSDWPHPSFTGNYLPIERNISDLGFLANWRTSYFASNLAESFNLCVDENNCNSFAEIYFGVGLIDPVNHYVKSDRAIKYALLFIALTFASFFLFEILKRLMVHPVQYGLVGLALAFFYLLLLSLSEHIGFAAAYLISAVACILLLGTYVSHVLQSLALGLGFTTALSMLYGMLYGLLCAEDYALLMGSILLFALLGMFMLLTRKVDWYSMGKAKITPE